MTGSHVPSILYGQSRVPVILPETASVDVVGRRSAGDAEESRILRAAIANPIDASSFNTFLDGAERPLIIVNDATRSTPTAKIIEPLLPSLRRYPTWRVIVATGLHRAPTDAERLQIFGSCLPDVRSHLLIHDGNSPRAILLEQPEGNIVVHPALHEADRVIVITSVEPHFFAGYTGGRKSLIPGLCGHDTVQQSHAAAVSAEAVALKLEGNPVRAFIETKSRFKTNDQIWSIQVVLDRNDQIAEAFAGDIDTVFDKACRSARSWYSVPVTEPYDIVIAAVHPPMDINLYQAQKAWELNQTAVRDDGVIIITSPCVEGVGSPFYQRLSEEFPNQDEWLGLAERPYTMGLHKLVRTARVKQRLRLMAVTDMPPDTVAAFGYEAHTNLDTAIATAIGHVGTNARVLIVEDAALTTTVRQSVSVN